MRQKMDSLPDELVIEALTNLTLEEVQNVCSANRRIQRICNTKDFWFRMLNVHFPKVSTIGVTDPQSLYLSVRRNLARQQLLSVMDSLVWDLTQSTQKNLESYSSITEVLTRPVTGLDRLVLYYPLSDRYYQRVEYDLKGLQVSPLQVLESIEIFYDQPITWDNVAAIERESGDALDYVELTPNSTALQLLNVRTFLTGMRPFQDGFLLTLEY